ncbi:hypothetical protein S547_004804, partial [Salmonella enterica subsp. enterica serovar Minnesota]|nr:hypothetical protein [Salmonella enterica subsp. enterica serovar Minnesota]
GAQPDTLLADGQSQTTVTVVLKSGDNQPATGLADQLALSGKLTPDSGLVTRLRSLLRNRAATREPVLTALKEDSTQPGTYTATLTAGTTAGKYALTLALSGEPLLNAQVLLTDTMADTSQSGLTADKNQIAASDGTDPQNRVTFTATLTDRDGKPVSGEAGRLKLATTAGVDTARLAYSDLKESQPGSYTGTLSSTLAVKDLPVVLMINGKNSGKTATVTVTADDTSATPVLTVTKNSAVADGQDADTLAVAVTDKYTNPVENQAVTLSATPADVTFAATPVTTGPDGKAQATLTSLTPGDKAITATLANGNSAQENVTFLPDPNAVVNTLAVTDHNGQTTDSLPVGTTDASAFTVTAEVQDSSGNPAPANLKVNWTLDQASCPVPAGALKDASSLTDTTGHAVMTITSADPHQACDGLKVTAVVDGATRSAMATLTYTADTASAKVDTVTMTSDHTVFLADGNDSAEYTAAVTDQYGNPVSGTAVTWTTTGGKLANAQTTTDPQGNTSGTLTDTQAETVTVSAAAGTSQPTAADKTVEFRTATLQNNTPDATEKPVGDGPGSTFTFTATVMDNTGVPVKDAEIKWRQDGGTDYRLSADTVRTDDQGQAQVTLTDPMHKATDRITVTATYNSSSVGADVAYVADATTAAVSALTLADPTVTTRAADGTDAFTWNALVTDQYGNKVKNADVTWSTDTAGTPPAQTTSQTGATGEASTTLTSATPVSNVHMQAKTAVQQTAYTSPAGVSFVVQGAATIAGAVTTDNSVADGATADVVTITVTDPAGNPVTGVDLTADLSKANGVQTTDGNTRWALDAAGKATISFTTTVAGTHSIAFTVPESASAHAGAGTVNLTFVAGPVDAAQSEVTVPVGAAVQGDPLELHLYARDANRNPVSAAQLDKVNVAIAATGTGVTLTATPQGDDTDATGPYRKYSLVPDTASYATQAIRYNTVTVQVNGANVGTEYHAAWSPDIDLSNGWPAQTYGWDAYGIVSQCPTAMVVDSDANVYTISGEPGRKVDETCGSDTATGLHVRVRASTSTVLTKATARIQGYSRYASWTAAGSPITKHEQCGTTGCADGGWARIVDENYITTTGGATVSGAVVVSAGAIDVNYSTASDNATSPYTLNIQLGVLDGDNKGKTSQVFTRSVSTAVAPANAGGASDAARFYSAKFYTQAEVAVTNKTAWFDRFTLEGYYYSVGAGTCEPKSDTDFPGKHGRFDGWFVMPVESVVGSAGRVGLGNGDGTGEKYWFVTSADPSKLYILHRVSGAAWDDTYVNKWVCTSTYVRQELPSEKDQNIVAPHYLKYRRYQ